MKTPSLAEFGKIAPLKADPMPKSGLSFKAGTPAASKRSNIAEGIAKKNPKLGMANKFAIATAVTKKLFKKKKGY